MSGSMCSVTDLFTAGYSYDAVGLLVRSELREQTHWRFWRGE